MAEIKFDLQTFADFTEFPQGLTEDGNPIKYRRFSIAELEHYGLHYIPTVFLLLAESLDTGIEFWSTGVLPESLDSTKGLLKLAYDENGMPNALYGPTICRNGNQLVLSYGDFEFPVNNEKNTLIIGGLQGNFEIEKNQDGSKKFLKARLADKDYATGEEFVISCLLEDWENPPTLSELNGKLNKNESIVELFKPLMPPITLMDELPNGDYKVIKIGEPKEGQYGLNVVINCEGMSTFLQKGHPSHMKATKDFTPTTKETKDKYAKIQKELRNATDEATKSELKKELLVLAMAMGDWQVINFHIEENNKEWILRIVDGGLKKTGVNKGKPKKNSQLIPASQSFPSTPKEAPLMLSASVETVPFEEVVKDAQASLFSPEKELVTAGKSGKKTKDKPSEIEPPF
jgi:hypothetical protein